MAVTKAHLDILYKGKEKVQVPCLFNPESISITHANTWSGSKASPLDDADDGEPDNSPSGHPIQDLEFGGRSNGTMSLKLFFDTTDTGKPVTQYTDKILAAMEIDAEASGASEKSQNAQPPCVVFRWGQMKTFESVITSATVTFTYFSSTGVPLRADVDLALTQFGDEKAFPRQNPTSGTLQPHRVHRVQPGETLDRISARYYRDSTRWRMLAAANGIEDPLAIRPGSLITVPMLDSP